MRYSLLIFLLSCHHILQLLLGNEITLTRHFNGDVFTIPGACNEACMVISSETARPSGSHSSMPIHDINDTCSCKCNIGLPVFREDLHICVDNIQECDVASFVSTTGLIEKVPYVILPEQGHIIHSHSEIKFEGVESPICVITGVQHLGKSGWLELRNTSYVEYPLSFLQEKQQTFLQWTGDTKFREAVEGKILIVKLVCRDSYPNAVYRGVFTPCIAFRVAGTPARNNIKEVSFSTSSSNHQGLTNTEYTAIGISSILLAIIYIASISLYLQNRKVQQKTAKKKNPEVGHLRYSCDIESRGIIKCNPLLSISRNYESDSNSAVSEADLADKLLHTESESEIEKITSALIHSHENNIELRGQNYNTGVIIGERIPEEDVRVIETTDNGNQSNMSLFPGPQRRKLYFNPTYFERQLLLSPPPPAIEFLVKLREVISIAKHKMTAKRFVPTLYEIPEESSSEYLSFKAVKINCKHITSVQSKNISLRYSNCPSCFHSTSIENLPTIGSISGENRVRAWLEDVKLLDARWRNFEEKCRQQYHQQLRCSKFIRNDRKNINFESAKLSVQSLPSVSKEHNFPEMTLLCPENYALVSEVYVNDSYISPTDSDDDSGPEIQCEPQNPGHLTIRVLDSPKNYIKQDESEYEPDTLDRKPMKLKINDEIVYDKDIVNEVYVDSLERTSQILLRCKKSFKQDIVGVSLTKSPGEYNSLREIYEARIKYQERQQQIIQLKYELKNDQLEDRFYKTCIYMTLSLQGQKCQEQKKNNQPDIVPKSLLQQELKRTCQIVKNVQDRSLTTVDDPITRKDGPVAKAVSVVGTSPIIRRKMNSIGGLNENKKETIKASCIIKPRNLKKLNQNVSCFTHSAFFNTWKSLSIANGQKNQQHQQHRCFSKWRSKLNRRSKSADKSQISSRFHSEICYRSHSNKELNERGNNLAIANFDDSAYVSSPNSNDSRRQLLFQDSVNSSSYTESDESTNGNGVNSETGAESIETDSVFWEFSRALRM